MAAPESYLTSYEKVCRRLEGLKRAEVREIARSPGGRPLHAVAYGEFEPVARTANLSSALAAKRPEAFYGAGRRKQSLLIVSAVHGGEMESIAGVMNLVSLMETGRDLDGVEWPRLRECCSRLRLVVVPVANPDGRARIDSDDPTGWSNDQTERYRHGLDASGKPIGWPACKTPHPRDPRADSVLGGYFNDAGVNPHHGGFLDRSVAPETHAVLDLALEETADCFLELHSCGAGPFFMVGYDFLPPAMSERQSCFDGAWRAKMRAAGLPAPGWTTRGISSSIVLTQLAYHRAGALPLLFEGGSGSRYKSGAGGRSVYRQIIETYMLLFEAVAEIGVEEGFRA
jgi:hypothetical protein